MKTPTTLQVAAVLLWLPAVGFGASTLPTIRNLLTGRDLPVILGIRAFGGGEFERHGTQATVGLLVAFLVVCILECLAGWWLWNGERRGAFLALTLVPVGAVFWWGFALPFPPLLAVARIILILVGWKSLR